MLGLTEYANWVTIGNSWDHMSFQAMPTQDQVFFCAGKIGKSVNCIQKLIHNWIMIMTEICNDNDTKDVYNHNHTVAGKWL